MPPKQKPLGYIVMSQGDDKGAEVVFAVRGLMP